MVFLSANQRKFIEFSKVLGAFFGSSLHVGNFNTHVFTKSLESYTFTHSAPLRNLDATRLFGFLPCMATSCPRLQESQAFNPVARIFSRENMKLPIKKKIIQKAQSYRCALFNPYIFGDDLMFGSPPHNSISKTKFSVKKHAAMPSDRLFGVIVGTFLHSLLDIQGNMTPGDFE